MSLFNLLRVLLVLARSQILIDCDVKLPLKLKMLGYLITLVFCPIGLIKKPKSSFGNRLTDCFKKLGPIYIKFGQSLSTRPDLVGHKIAKSLRHLQDKLPSFDFVYVKELFQASFGANIEELFTSFEQLPIAAASIAQVHKAELQSGEKVAVKILRPNIRSKYEQDLRLFYFFAKIIPFFFKKYRRLKLLEVVNLFQKTMKLELDLRMEASACSELRDNFESDHDIYIPKIYWQVTSEDILTLEWIDGISIYDSEQLLQHNLNPASISQKIAVSFFNQAYRDGFFHADLHPGNILVMKDSKIALLDFGIMGRLPERDRIAIAEILLNFINRDYRKVAEIHLRVGYIKPDTDLDLFAQSCRAVTEPIIGLPIKDISIGKLLMQLFKITEDFGMETQPQLLLLQKTMVVVEGIGHSLNPDINMWELARPWMSEWAKNNLSHKARILKLVRHVIDKLLISVSK